MDLDLGVAGVLTASFLGEGGSHSYMNEITGLTAAYSLCRAKRIQTGTPDDLHAFSVRCRATFLILSARKKNASPTGQR